MRCKHWRTLLVVGLTIGSVFAQDVAAQTSPAAGGRVVRVRIVHTGGLCGGSGYCTDITTFEPSIIILELKDSPNKQKFPDKKMKDAVMKKDWETLQRAIDRKSLAALPQEVCQAAIDLPCSWVEVEFNDGTKISVSYDRSNPPAPIDALLRKLPPIRVEP
jgi:hypothetical protein